MTKIQQIISGSSCLTVTLLGVVFAFALLIHSSDDVKLMNINDIVAQVGEATADIDRRCNIVSREARIFNVTAAVSAT